MPRHRFILFEGVDGSGKTSLAKLLAADLGGQYYHSPPQCLEPLRAYANSATPQVRYRYYLLGNYITSHELSKLLESFDVVVDKYLYSTIAFHQVLLKQKLELPQDILLPDHIFFTTASKTTIEARLGKREQITAYEGLNFLTEVDEAYKKLFQSNPKVTIIDTSGKTTDESFVYLQNIFKELKF
jgi:deoxyguanosine kinase